MALFTFTPPHTVTAHSKSQGPRSTIMSMVNKHFEKKEPFIYQKPDLFAPLWVTPSPLEISTQDAKANKAMELNDMKICGGSC
ncbi:hypothetical protein K443DRAFT_12606 [Laccaria amethystina LaAM-08-1]|uniref:Uncharacterized protein n=1 Tax=Laccaria amethystina LaAM-08-1 TaxID=1095629 RepID=A0A0C9WR38_9AGAR|nr:hypothetical protein K443DRAFT_12606 [Laccaria amethystina LaAM-08-1]